MGVIVCVISTSVFFLLLQRVIFFCYFNAYYFFRHFNACYFLCYLNAYYLLCYFNACLFCVIATRVLFCVISTRVIFSSHFNTCHLFGLFQPVFLFFFCVFFIGNIADMRFFDAVHLVVHLAVQSIMNSFLLVQLHEFCIYIWCFSQLNCIKQMSI